MTCKLSFFFSMGPGNILRKYISSAKRMQGRKSEEDTEPDGVYNAVLCRDLAFMQPAVQYQEIPPRLVSWHTSSKPGKRNSKSLHVSMGQDVRAGVLFLGFSRLV